jgi:hypothetical protein
MPAALERIRARAEKAGVEYVFMTATHTHHAPVMEMADAPHTGAIEGKIGDCIEEAAGRLQPARIGIGRTEIDIAHNRRILRDGKCFMLWRNEKKVPTSPVDKEAAIIKICSENGEPLAALVHFACHPVVMGPSNCRYSADYAGEMTKVVKEQTGAECLFLQGACGNINPYLDKTSIENGAVEAMRAVGRVCAAKVLAALDVIDPDPTGTASVKFEESGVPVGFRWVLGNPETLAMLRRVYGPMYDVYMQGVGPALTAPLSVLVVNDALALVGMPGEIFVQFQMDLKSNSPLRNTFLCGYANGYYAYFPTIQDAAAGGYGGSVASYVGVGAGERLTTEAKIAIGRMIGKINPACSAADFEIVDES